MKQVVLVNGVPASGKSTVTRNLTAFLNHAGISAVPLALDTLKEGLFAEIGIGDRDHNRLLGRASYHAIFNLVEQFPETLVPVVDAWHGFQPPEVLRRHLDRAKIGRVIELWCAVSPDVAAERYRGRTRAPGHPPASYAEELRQLVGRAKPLGQFGPVISVDTEAPFDPAICEQVLAFLRAA